LNSCRKTSFIGWLSCCPVASLWDGTEGTGGVASAGGAAGMLRLWPGLWPGRDPLVGWLVPPFSP
jgi:hypothetical protein